MDPKQGSGSAYALRSTVLARVAPPLVWAGLPKGHDLRALAVVTNDEPSVSLEGFEIRFSVGGYDGLDDKIVLTDATGSAEVTFSGLSTSGSGILSASMVDNSALTRTRDFVVVGGEPSEVALLLSTDDIEPGTDIADVPPDTDVYAQLVALDQADNEVDAPIVLVTDAPGALVQGYTITKVTEAGTWTVAANVLGTNITDTATMIFVPDAAATIDLSLDARTVQAGESVTATAVVIDMYNNVIEGAGSAVSLSLAPTPSAPSSPIDGNVITVEAPAGNFQITATLDADNTITATSELTVLPGGLDRFEVLLSDATGAPNATLTVGPEIDVTVTVVIEDDFGNPIDLPVSLSTDAPGQILDGVLTGVTASGTYVVMGQLVGRLETSVATLIVEPGPSVAASLALSSDVTTAGVPVTAAARALDAWGNTVSGETFGLSVVETVSDPAEPISGTEVTINAPAGLFTIQASLIAEPPPEPAIVAEASLNVVPARPDRVALVLSAPDETPGDPLDVSAGTDVDFDYSVVDAFDNPVSPTTVDVSINAPGAIVANDGATGGVISRLSFAGVYSVLAQVRGTDVTDLVALEVTASAASDIELVLSTNFVRVNDPVVTFFQVTDEFGNIVDDATVELSAPEGDASVPTPPVTSGAEVSFGFAGTWPLTASTPNAGTPVASDTEYVSVSEALDFLPPSVDIMMPVAETVFTPGATVAVQVHAVDDSELLSLGYETSGAVDVADRVLLSPGTSETVEPFFFTIPSRRFGQITIYAWAEDSSGNRSNAQPVTVFADVPNDIAFVLPVDRVQTVAAGYQEAALFSSSNDAGGIRQPREVTVSETGEIYVALSQNIILVRGLNFIGGNTDQEETYLSVILPDGKVNPFATWIEPGGIENFNTTGLAWTGLDRTLYAGIEFADLPDLIAFTPSGLEEIEDAPNEWGGLEYFADPDGPGDGSTDRVIAVDPQSETIFAIDDADLVQIFPPGDESRDGLWDSCFSGTTLYIPSSGRLEACTFTPEDDAAGDPSTCDIVVDIIGDADNLDPLLQDVVHSCAVSESGNVYITNWSSLSVIQVDPSVESPVTTEVIWNLSGPWGIDFDPLTNDMLISDDSRDSDEVNAVYRFIAADGSTF